jgi:hypothetical protein
VEVWPLGIDAGAYAAVTVTGGAVMSVHDPPAALVTPCVDVIPPVATVTILVAAAGAVTFTETVHVAPTASDAPLSVSVCPAIATLPLAHVVAAFGVAANAALAGNVSGRPTLVSAIALPPVFASVTVNGKASVLVVCAVAGNVSVTAEAGLIVSIAFPAAALLTPCVVVIADAATVSVYVFATDPVTLTESAHDAPAASVAPESASVVPPALADALPAVQVVAAFGVVAIVRPVGNVLLSASAVSGIAELPVFAMLIVSVVVAPGSIDVGANVGVTASDDGVFTVSIALADARLVTFCVELTASAGIVAV